MFPVRFWAGGLNFLLNGEVFFPLFSLKVKYKKSVCVLLFMLGKDHINISIAFVIPFLIPLVFLNVGDMLIFVTFLFAVFVGSLLPDTDCGGKATIYYKFPEIDNFMKKVVGKSIKWTLNHLISKEKIKVEHEVNDEHRGIMHSPIGVLLTSIILSLPIFIFALVFNMFNFGVILAIFFGLLIGQLLHLFEDSCTISGINWLFPFKTKELKGKIYTFSKDPERKDIRPMLYAGILYFLIGVLVFGYSFNTFNNINVWLMFLGILIYEIITLVVITSLSQSNSSIWMVKKGTIRQINKHTRRFEKNAGRF